MIERLLAVLAVVAVAAALRWWRSRRSGRVRTVDAPQSAAATTVDLARFGLRPRPGAPAALLFGTAACAPCDRVKALLREVSTELRAFDWTYADAAEHLDLARRLRIMRVPTLVVVDDRGAVVARATGVPRRDELVRAVTTPSAGADRPATVAGDDSP